MKPWVLIVDDSLTVRMDLQEAFESIGFAASISDTLAAARKALAERQFSLIILDVLLPDGDGVDLLREIKNNPTMATTPVILLSTEAEVRDRVRGLKTGADKYVGKPYDRANLLACARQLVRIEGPSPVSVLKLLLIDDSLTFRNEFKAVLENAGYGVITAQSGEEGLRTAVAARPDAVIVNGVLPGSLDGAAVIRRLKDDVTLRNTPCLLLTATESTGDELRTFEAGADAYVRKSVDTELILARIVALLRSLGPQLTDPAVAGLLGPKKILTVDDSPTYLHELSEELHKEGYDVIPARSGKEALELLEVEEVDCILLDLLMPELSGQETCRIIKKTSAWRNVPLLILTAVEETKAMVEGINAGADDYIPKSSDFEVLKARLRAQLRRKQFEDEYRGIRERLSQKEIEAARAKAAQEIAEAKASFEPLLRNEAWLNNVVRIAHLGAWDWDLLKNTQSWSDEQFRIFGLLPGTVDPGYDRFVQAIHPEDRQRVLEVIGQAIAKEPRFQIECRVVWPDGDLRHAVCQGELCRDEVDKAVRIIGTVLDITERKRAEEEVRKLNVDLEQRVLQRTAQLVAANKELEAFSYSVSHDLRAPLRAINGFAQILLQEHKRELSPEAQRCLDQVCESGAHMGHLIDDLLAFARLGRQDLNKKLVRSDEIVQAAIEDLRADREGRQVELILGALPACETDPALLRQVFVNLISNALKFTRQREQAQIEIGSLSTNEREKLAGIQLNGCPTEFLNSSIRVFYVRDNGVGFDMRYADKLFGVFQRLHKKSEFEGTGVGLATVQRIIQRQGGRVWADAEVNKGATFYFTLEAPAAQTSEMVDVSAACAT